MGKIKEKIKNTGRKVEDFCDDHYNTILCCAIGTITGGALLVMHNQGEAYERMTSKIAEEYAKSLTKDSGTVCIEENSEDLDNIKIEEF